MSAKKAGGAAKPEAKKGTALSGLADMLGSANLASMLAVPDVNAPVFSIISIADIKILPQHRGSDAMEEPEQTLEELGADIKAQGVLQPVLICNNQDGPEPYRLMAGERRIRSSLLVNLGNVPSMVYGDLTEEQINRIQYAENVHRLNLRQIDEAKVLQRDIERLGSVEAAAAHHNKSISWVSKRISLLTLPPESARLIKEQVSADPEVINAVKQIETRDPAAAKAVVDKLKDERGQKGSNARTTVKEAKDKVKPPTTPRKSKATPADPASVATAKDLSHEAPGAIVSVPLAEAGQGSDNQGDNTSNDEEQRSMLDDMAALDADNPSSKDGDSEDAPEPNGVGKPFANSPVFVPAALDRIYSLVAESGSHPKTILENMDKVERDDCKNWLMKFWEAGTAVKPKTLVREVAKGFRTGKFADSGHGMFALLAFVCGSEEGGLFSLLDIVGSVKP